MNRWFCRHTWDVRATTVAKPRPGLEVEGRGEHLVRMYERGIHGFSDVLLTCSKCGAVEVHRLLGATEASP